MKTAVLSGRFLVATGARTPQDCRLAFEREALRLGWHPEDGAFVVQPLMDGGYRITWTPNVLASIKRHWARKRPHG